MVQIESAQVFPKNPSKVYIFNSKIDFKHYELSEDGLRNDIPMFTSVQSQKLTPSTL